MIQNHYDKLADIKRLENTEGYKKSHVVIHSAVPCHVQPIGADLQINDGIAGKDWLMFCDFIDIQEQDRVFIENDGVTYEYRVVGVEKFEFRGRKRHMEVQIKINDQPDKK